MEQKFAGGGANYSQGKPRNPLLILGGSEKNAWRVQQEQRARQAAPLHVRLPQN